MDGMSDETVQQVARILDRWVWCGCYEGDVENLYPGARRAVAEAVVAEVVGPLRAILAPLLDKPWRDDAAADRTYCMFCGSELGTTVEPLPDSETAEDHRPDCPVLRASELLGRDPARA